MRAISRASRERCRSARASCAGRWSAHSRRQYRLVRDEVHLRGTFVPFYGLNNMFGQIPIVGLFLGGGNKEGLVGINYEAVGPPGSPHHGQSGQRDRASPAAQIYPFAGHIRPELPAALAVRNLFGLNCMWRFLPSDRLWTPSGVTFCGVSVSCLSVMTYVVDFNCAILDLTARSLVEETAPVVQAAISTPTVCSTIRLAMSRKSPLLQRFCARFPQLGWRRRGRARGRSLRLENFLRLVDLVAL